MNFKVLCIDGGGVRGIYPAYILKRIEEVFAVRLHEIFDMVVGTSTGSIIASAIAVDYRLKDVVNIFEEKSRRIFRKTPFSFGGVIASRYDRKELEDILKLALGSRTLSETKTRLVIPATDLVSGNVHVFKSKYLDEFVRDTDVKIADAVLASCAAPTYFDPKTLGEASYMLADGGLWANNPSMVALTEAIGKLGLGKNQVKILSVGTGSKQVSYEIGGVGKKKWGALLGWEGKKLLDMILYLQSVSDTNKTKLILGENYLRLDHDSDKELPLDNVNVLTEMKNRADFTFTHNSEKVKSFLEIG
ncbi:MAG: patatin-like phospholipase family protein [Anaerolineales bacterium]|nr:patatin-like phospholipase family protein [Anaerolineales bacterium]